MSLDVYLYGERIATLFPAGENDYRLAFVPGVVDEVGAGVALLSNALPTRTEPYSAWSSRTYVEGLLPDGLRRLRLARELDVDPGDGYALIAELGRDCAGAVAFLPTGAEPGPSNGDGRSVAWLSEGELEELVAPPPPRLFDPGTEPRMRFALAGLRHKLSLVRDGPGGRWGWPEFGVPSTHVIKPETGEFPEYVANEMFCTSVVREVGLPAVETTVERIGGRACLVSKRFDRAGEGPAAKRIHQENFCQALGVPPDDHGGEEGNGGPGFAEACGLLKAVAAEDDASLLFRAAFCNYMLGNGDAHGENFALLFDDGRMRLAPLHDIASTAVYDDPTHTGMVISEEYSETAYLLELAQIAEECDFDFDLFRGMAAATAEKVGHAIDVVAERSREEGWYQPVIDGIAELAGERAFGLGAEVEY